MIQVCTSTSPQIKQNLMENQKRETVYLIENICHYCWLSENYLQFRWFRVMLSLQLVGQKQPKLCEFCTHSDLLSEDMWRLLSGFYKLHIVTSWNAIPQAVNKSHLRKRKSSWVKGVPSPILAKVTWCVKMSEYLFHCAVKHYYWGFNGGVIIFAISTFSIILWFHWGFLHKTAPIKLT